MASLEQLQAERQALQQKIQAKGGRGAAPKLTQKLKALQGQIQAAGGGVKHAVGGGRGGKKKGPTVKKVGNQIDKIDSGGDLWKSDVKGAGVIAGEGLGWLNPTVQNPFGTSTTTIDPATGLPVVTETLSGNQGAILEGGEELSKWGQGQAMGNLQGGGFSGVFNPELAARASGDDLLSFRQDVQSGIYDDLTRNFDRDQQAQVTDAETKLRAQGIPFSDDPKSRYQTELRNINEGFDQRRQQALGQAYQFGGQEAQNQFGMQEQLRSNQFGEQTGTINQNWQNVNQLGGLGTGLMLPSFNPYQSSWQNPMTPGQAWAGWDASKQGWASIGNQGKQIDAQIQAANRPPVGAPPQEETPPIVGP